LQLLLALFGSPLAQRCDPQRNAGPWSDRTKRHDKRRNRALPLPWDARAGPL